MKIISVLFLLIILGCSRQNNEQALDVVVNDAGISVVPSPASEYIGIYINNPIDGYIDLSIMSLYGETLIKVKAGYVVKGYYNFGVDISNLAEGLYLAYLQTNLSSKKCYFAVYNKY